MSKNNGGSAFPQVDEQFIYMEDRGMVGTRGYGEVGDPGMTMRDYFAAKAMQGMLVNGPERGMTSSFLASESYRIADAMLEERNK